MVFSERSGSEARTASAHGGRQRLSPWAALWRNSRGVVAVEFALVSIPLFTLVLGVFEIGYDLFVQATLDRVAQETAHTIQVGSTASDSGNTTQFMTDYVCPLATGLLNCSDISINLQTVATGTSTTNYASVTFPTYPSTTAVCTGAGGDAMLLTIWYAGPTFLGALFPGFSIRPTASSPLIHLTTSSAGFVNEHFPIADAGSC